MSDRHFRVLDAANQAADKIIRLIDAKPRRLLHMAQLRGAAEGIPANISEGLGRAKPRDRSYKYEVARGEAKETLTHLGSNYRNRRINKEEYLPIYNLLQTIVKMLDALILP